MSQTHLDLKLHSLLVVNRRSSPAEGMQRLTFNFSGKVKKVVQNGKEWLVAPLSLINVGVLNGSKGPLFYPEDEITKNYQQWNGMPLLIYHPHRLGQPISANDPEVLQRQGVGIVKNAQAKGKLRAEGWFDAAKLKKVSPQTYNRLIRGEPIELSTGLYTDNEELAGNYNGRPYTHVARNYRADHIAILPDQIGACSINDGCGVLVNQKNQETLMTLQEKIGQLLSNRDVPGRDKMDDADFAGPDRSFPIKTQEDLEAAVKSIGRSKASPDTIKAGIRRIAKRKGLTLPDSWVENEEDMDTTTENAWTDEARAAAAEARKNKSYSAGAKSEDAHSLSKAVGGNDRSDKALEAAHLAAAHAESSNASGASAEHQKASFNHTRAAMFHREQAFQTGKQQGNQESSISHQMAADAHLEAAKEHHNAGMSHITHNQATENCGLTNNGPSCGTYAGNDSDESNAARTLSIKADKSRTVALTGGGTAAHATAASDNLQAAAQHDLLSKTADSPFAEQHAAAAKDHMDKWQSHSRQSESRNENTYNSNHQEGGPTMADVKLTAEEREAVVNGLIENCGECGWNGDDRPILNEMSDVTLAKLNKQMEIVTNAVAEKDTDEEVAVKEKKIKGGDSVVKGKPTGELNPTANALSNQDRQVLQFGYAQLNQIKRGHIAVITANAQNKFTKPQLEAMDLGMLENLASLAKARIVDNLSYNRLPSFFGAQGSAEIVDNSQEEEPLTLGKIDYAQLAVENRSNGRKLANA